MFTKKPKLKTIFIVLLALAGLGAAISGSLAAYTSQAYQRGVARNRDTQSAKFTSNYLQSCAISSDSYPARIISYAKADNPDSAQTTDIEVWIYNYIVGNDALVNEKDIKYDMEIVFNGGSGDYKVAYNEGNFDSVSQSNSGTETSSVYKYTKTSTLTGRVAHSDHYVIKISMADIDKVTITAVATPQNSSATGGQKLAAVIAPSTQTQTQTFACNGTFTDSSGGDIDNYAAFNYEVSITSGKAEVTITWNEQAVEIDPFFVEKLKTRGDEYKIDGEYYVKTSNSLRFIMNQSDGTGTYLIPFYRVNKEKIPSDWSGMSEIISVKGKQIP